MSEGQVSPEDQKLMIGWIAAVMETVADMNSEMLFPPTIVLLDEDDEPIIYACCDADVGLVREMGFRIDKPDLTALGFIAGQMIQAFGEDEQQRTVKTLVSISDARIRTKDSDEPEEAIVAFLFRPQDLTAKHHPSIAAKYERTEDGIKVGAAISSSVDMTSGAILRTLAWSSFAHIPDEVMDVIVPLMEASLIAVWTPARVESDA